MIRSLHVIDKDTSADMLRQLALLAGPGEPVVCPGPPPAHLPQTVKVKHLRPFFDVGAWADRQLGFPPFNPQVVHAWSLLAREAGYRFARDLQCPLIVSLEGPPAGLVDEAACCLRGTKASVATTLLVSADPIRSAWISAGEGSDAVAVLPAPAAEIADAPHRRRCVRAELGIPEDEMVLVSPEDMVRGAGQKYAIWCHAILRQILPAARLILPGHGPYESSVRYFSGTTGYGSETIFTGERFPIEDALAAADIALFLGERDNSPSALASAMAGGSAIVASRTPAQAHALEHDATALLTPLRDPRRATAAILKFCDSADLRHRLGAAAQILRDARPAHVRALLEQIYENALTRCGKGSQTLA
jgi:glycosyltransferase involved in cell wall biosynthesis